MIASEPLIPNDIVKQILLANLVSFCMRQYWSAEQLFKGAGYDLTQLRMGTLQLQVQDYLTVLEYMAKQKDCPDIALRLGNSLQIEHLGIFGGLIASSANMVMAIQVFSRFRHLLQNAFNLQLIEETAPDSKTGATPSRLWLTEVSYTHKTNNRINVHNDKHTTNLTHRYLSEILFAAIVNHINQLSAAGFVPLRIEFCHPAPPYRQQYWHYFQSEVVFNQPVNRMLLPASVKTLPLKTQNSRYHHFLLTQIENFLSPQLSQKSQIEAYLTKHLAEPKHCTLAAVASYMNRSERSLQRDLQAQNTSIQALLDLVRQQQALSLVATSKLSVMQISQALGFKYPSSFATKFKTWTGFSPSAYRKHNHNSPSKAP